eukprot:TRINITY_DN7908_c0_g1_i1.p1 TRINITY_DN7908_c0_g1~~TRINITY_DN7908_c0_g1_i1.p1  ORF type:complete len:269 (-),score=41.73 TRINITY_DN7908_c0_g1_i1:87-893(-)
MGNKNVIKSFSNSHFKFEATVSNDKGQRMYMEDTYNFHIPIIDDVFLFSIFDGHSGLQGSSYLKKNFPKKFLHYYKSKHSIEDCLTDSINDLEKEFLDYCKSKNMNSGSTILIGIIKDMDLYLANVGDSRAIGLKNNSFDLTHDHKPNTLKEKDRIEKNGGFVEHNRLNGILGMSRSFGDLHLKTKKDVLTCTPDIYKYNLLDDDIRFFILTSDGLFDKMKTDDVIKFVSRRINQDKKINQITKELIEYSLHQGNEDNHTIILVTIKK